MLNHKAYNPQALKGWRLNIRHGLSVLQAAKRQPGNELDHINDQTARREVRSLWHKRHIGSSYK